MATKYSGSLDVGEELDEENKRPPVIDDSDDGEETSAEDDFNDLIRRELGDITPQPKKKDEPKQEITIEPVKEVPKIEPKPEVKPAPKPKVVKTEAPKAEAKIEKPVEKKEIPKPAPKVEKKVEPKKEIKKPEPKKVEKPAPKVKKEEPKKPEVKKAEPKKEPPKASRSEPASKGTRWMTLIILLLVAAGAVYAVHALRNGKDNAALGCASSYASQRGGISLSWHDASSVEQYWLKQAFESASELEAARIFHMLACPDAFLSTLSDPAGYVNCPAPSTYIIIDEHTIEDNPIAALDDGSVLTKLASGKASRHFALKYNLAQPSVTAWEVQLNATKTY